MHKSDVIAHMGCAARKFLQIAVISQQAAKAAGEHSTEHTLLDAIHDIAEDCANYMDCLQEEIQKDGVTG